MVRLIRKRGPGKTKKFHLTEGLIIEILSWLPVKYVLRCKSVSKLWQSIIEDRAFIEKHLSRSKSEAVFEDIRKSNPNQETFIFHHGIKGLVVERNAMTFKFRIRNYATKQVVEVLDTGELDGGRRMMMDFDSSTNEYKLIYVHYNKGTFEDVGVKVLTLGTDVAWRSLDSPFLHERTIETLSVEVTSNICYIISSCKADLEKPIITGLIKKHESFVKINIPMNFQSGGRGDDFRTFIWGDKLSIGFIFETQLHVWVLENYTKQIWSQEKIISLTFMNIIPNTSNNNLVIYSNAPAGRLTISLNSEIVRYDIKSQKVLPVLEMTTPPGKKRYCYSTPSLVSLPGMHPEGINVVSKDPGRRRSLVYRFKRWLLKG